MQGVKFYRDKLLPFFELKVCNTAALSYKKHAHEEYSIGLIEQGRSCFWYEGKTETVASDRMVLLPPGLVHACNPMTPDNWRYIMLFVDAEWMKAFIGSRDEYSFDCPIIKSLSTTAGLQKSKTLLATIKTCKSPLEKETNILRLFEAALSGDKQTSGSDDLALFHNEPGVQRIREYLRDCFLEKVTLDQLAYVSGLNKFHVIRLFKAAYHIPPHAYQTLLRVNYAKNELRKKRRLIDVAMAAGFYDQSHFIKVFKSYTGVTPEQYQ